MAKEYEVAIVGGGVTGTAILYVLSKYTNVKNIALVEKYGEVAQVNSRHNNNSQTLHFGDIETNYTLEKAARVKEAADMVKVYVERFGRKGIMFNKTKKMALAIGEREVEVLSRRYKEFKKLFPDLKRADRKKLEKIEPNVVKGRNPRMKMLALVSENGYSIDYGRLAESFVEEGRKTHKHIDVRLGTKVEGIKKKGDVYEVTTGNGEIHARAVVVAAGSHSLLIAQGMGYGTDYAVLPVAGSFYVTENVLNNKVYMMQLKKLPFAAIHGDPEVHHQHITRFGPTAKVLPVLERRNPGTFWDFLKVSSLDPRGIYGLFKILSDWTIFKYVFRNFLYDLPVIGKRLFIREVRKIVPSIRVKDLKFAREYGGIRPQMVYKPRHELQMGEAKIVEDGIIFNMTPSPGASTCLKNAHNDTKALMKFLGKGYRFDEKLFLREFSGQ